MTVHESHYDVMSSTIVGTAATMLTLIATLGSSNEYILSHPDLKRLLVVELGLLLFTIVIGVFSLIRRSRIKTSLAIATALGLILGAVLLAYISAVVLLS
jgi:hypothetical protein